MSRRELAAHIVLYAFLFVFLAKILPWFVFFPLAVVLTVLHLLLRYRSKKQALENIMEKIKNVQGETLVNPVALNASKDIDKLFIESFKETAAELEKKCYQLVEKNIQLLSMKELGLTIISSLDEKKVVESVNSFLSKGLGFKEFFVSIFDPESAVFNIYTYRDAYGETSKKQFGSKLKEMEGLLQKTIVSQRSILIRDPAMHPMGSIDGQSLFDDSTMSTFVLVPLLKSTIANDCWKEEDCILKPDNYPDGGEFELVSIKCPACQKFPILGVIGVTDGFKAERLSQVDLVSVETLALQVSTILENSLLYNGLKKEEIFRDNVINSMMNGLITADSDGRIMLSNQTAGKLSGYSAEQLVGKNLDDVLIGAGKMGQDSSILQEFKRGRKVFQKEMWLIKKGGERIPIILNTSFLLDEDGNIQGVMAVFYDLTRIKRMEKTIRHLDKLAALGRFSTSIAHEIRNPLTGIAAGIQYLERAGNLPEDQRENISFILNEVDRIDRLIGDLMSTVREGDLIYENTSMETIIKNSIASLRDSLDKKKIKIRTVFPDNSREVQVDRDRITQVMINLIKNAIEASNPSGDILIEVSFHSSEEVSDVLFDGIGNYAIIKVVDHGVGLTVEEKEKIFEPFFSTKHEGTGLGLYVAHNFIERHGGSIIAESEPNKGTVFSLYLPTEKTQNGDSSKIGHPLSG